MNLWYTDNPLSCMVMSAIAEGNPSAVARHIKDFKKVIDNPSAGDVFYGILRGCGTAMRICNWIGANYYYIDNGYFEAEYVNQSMLKNMDGKFRVVKNDMIELYQGPRPMYEADVKRICLLVPPSPYTANFYDTTPEDFVQETAQHLFRHGVSVIVRDKSSEIPLEDQLGQCGDIRHRAPELQKRLRCRFRGEPTSAKFPMSRSDRDIGEVEHRGKRLKPDRGQQRRTVVPKDCRCATG